MDVNGGRGASTRGGASLLGNRGLACVNGKRIKSDDEQCVDVVYYECMGKQLR